MLIDTAEFIREMDNHWTKRLQNVSSDNLRRVWKQIGDKFNEHITNHGTPGAGTKWTVLQPPTGSGKSEGTAVYCSMLSSLPRESHPGVLIVTRLIEDTEYMASRINELSGVEVAVAYHSGSKDSHPLSTLKDWPVVVITHRAYEIALDVLGSNTTIEGIWDSFHRFNPEASAAGMSFFEEEEDRRKLVIVDEALDIVEHSQITADELRYTDGAIPQPIRRKYPREMDIIRGTIALLDHLDAMMKGDSQQELMITQLEHLRCQLLDHQIPDMSGLREALKEVRFDHLARKTDNEENRRLRDQHDATLRSLHLLFRQWAYYTRIHSNHTFNTSRLLIPENVKGAVVLDATASSNVMYDILDNAEVIAPPPGSRTYKNVRLHVSRGHKVGKRQMFNNARVVSEGLVASLNEILKGRTTFVCCHKGVEPVLSSYETTFDMRTGHWGAVDGSNEWKDCDSAVIFGLPYLPDYWAPNVFMAARGPQTTEWLRSSEARSFERHEDIREALKTGQMAVSIVQAINRVQCRKVIDDGGNCPATDVYIMLPADAVADKLLERIRAEMPGIVVSEDWKPEVAKRKPRRSNHGTALARYFGVMGVGKVAVGGVQKHLGISAATFKRLTAQLRDETTELYARMCEAGVQLISNGSGRGNRAYFVKPA